MTRYEKEYGNANVRDAVSHAIAAGWVISSIKPNPKRGKSRATYERYKIGQKVGLHPVDHLRWDLLHGFITLAPALGQIYLAGSPKTGRYAPPAS